MFLLLPMSEESDLAVANIVSLGCWGLLLAVIIWRPLLLIIRHRRTEIHSRVLAPLASALVVSTQAVGFSPVIMGDIVPQSTEDGGVLSPEPTRSSGSSS
ncbi:MAG: hypothetical protein H7248_04635 [Microbacteriaceae bacterium]|nr:hypothetical protein [Microbacteriaceae bacterium]